RTASRHLLKPMSVRLRQVFGFRSCLSCGPKGRVVTKIRSPRRGSVLLGGLRRSFVTKLPRWANPTGFRLSDRRDRVRRLLHTRGVAQHDIHPQRTRTKRTAAELRREAKAARLTRSYPRRAKARRQIGGRHEQR